MDLLGVEPSAGAVEKKRGRPKGSTNKRSEDLQRFIVATYGGMTPGQQAAAVGMVTAADVRRAKKAIGRTRLDPVMMAMATKARDLANVLGIDPGQAWELMRKERAELLAYVHQKLPQKVEIEAGDSLPLIVMAAAAPRGPVLDAAYEEVQGNQAFNAMVPVEVSHPKSHDDEEA